MWPPYWACAVVKGEPWEFGWDALVAIGTLALACVAVAVPLWIERVRRIETEVTDKTLRESLSQTLHDQVKMTALDLLMGAEHLSKNLRSTPDQAQREAGSVVPKRYFLLERFLDRLNIFGEAARDLTQFAASVLNIKMEMESISGAQIDPKQADFFWFKYKSLIKQMEEMSELGENCAAHLEQQGAREWPRKSTLPKE